MKIDVKENDDKVFRFELSGADSGFANALRRTAMSRVECFAIDKVTFYENTSAMFDEYIAHRIGLVPINSTGKHNADEEVLFTCEAQGPCTIYSKDLKSSDKEVRVANENIPIIKLADGQSIRIDAKAVLGNGYRHAKFQPGLATFEEKGDGKFDFYVESFGQLPPREIVSKAVEAIKDEMKELKKEAKK